MTQTKAELLQTRHQGDIRLGDADSTHYVGFKAPATVGTSLVWTLPATDGTAGYYLKTDGSGNLGWSLDNSGVSLSGSTNNTIATVTGANALQGEANLTFDGNYLTQNTDADQEGILIRSTGNTYNTITLDANRGTADYSLGDLRGKWNGTEVNRIRLHAGDDTTNKDDGEISFWTKISGGTNTERMRIDSAGNVGIGNTNPASLLDIANTGGAAEIICSSSTQPRLMLKTTGTTAECRIDFGDSGDSSRGAIGYNHSDDALKFYTIGVANERMRIDSSGRFLVGTSASIAVWGQNNRAQVIGSDWSTSGLTIGKLGNNTNAPNLVFGISRGTSVGTIVQSGDPVGQINWNADDGTDVNSTVASIKARIDGTPGANDTPGKLEFSTTADGAHSATERLTINSAGIFKFTGVITQVATAAGALDLNLNTSNYFTKTISGNSTFTFSNPAASGTVTAFTLELTHSSGTVTWPSEVKWNADTAPTLTTGKTHLFMFVTDDGGSRYRGSALVDYVN